MPVSIDAAVRSWYLLLLIQLHGGLSARLLTSDSSPPASNSSAESVLLSLADSLSNFQQVKQTNHFNGWSASAPAICSGGTRVADSFVAECDPENDVHRSAAHNPWTGVTCNWQGQVVCLHLDSLGISGTPEALTRLADLQSLGYLNLANNKLSGDLPPALGSALNELQILHLENNQLNGTLDPDWGTEQSFGQLESLYLQNNELDGTLPASWGQAGRWPALRILAASNNQLYGTVPSNYSVNESAFTALEHAVLLPGNKFCGPVPPDFPVVESKGEYVTGFDFKAVPQFNTSCAPAGVVPSFGSSDSLSEGAVAGIITGEVLCGVLLLVVAGIFHRRYRWRQERSWVLFDWDVVQERRSPKHFTFGGLWGRNSGQDTALEGGPASQNGFSFGSFGRISAHASGNGLLSSRSASGDKIEDPKAQAAGAKAGKNGTTARPKVMDLSEQIWEDSLIDTQEIRLQQNSDGSLKPLGNGSFGKVYKGVLQDVQEVAVKVFEGHAGQQNQELLLKEITILRSCRNKHVVQFFGVSFQKDDVWMIMELMEGNLFRHLARGHHCTWYFRGRSIALDIARGMHFLHSRRIIHMDLKSPNILIGETGIAKIADVGLARVMGSESIVNQMVAGTMHWMAPEVLVHGTCTEKADIFSFGVILWEICSGEAPTRGRMTKVSVPEECPQDVLDLIDSCMEEDPEKRLSALEIIKRIQEIPITTRPVPEPPWYAR